MTSQYDQQTITIHIFPNISESKINQAMKFGHLIEHNKRDIFFKIHEEHEVGKLVSGLFLHFKKVLYDVKVSGLLLNFNIVQ